MEKITIKDLYKYSFLSEVNACPDGSKVLFTKSNACEEYNNYTSRLYCIDTKTGENKAITAKGKEKSAIWLDNDTILFTSATANTDEKTQYFKLNLNGGEATEAFSIPLKVSSIKKIKDDLYAIISTKKITDESSSKEFAAQEYKDYLVFDEVPYWANGQGLRNKVRNVLSLFTPSTGEVKEISGKYTNVEGISACKRGKRILFWGQTFTDVAPLHNELYQYNVGSGYIETIIDKGILATKFAQYFGGKILVEGSDQKDNTSQDPTLYTIASDNVLTKLSYLDGALSSSSGSDVSYGGGKTINFTNGILYCLFTSWGNSFLSTVNAKGELAHINQTVGSISCFDIVGNTAYCVAMRNYEPQEIYTINLEDGAETKITNFNTSFVETHSVSKPDYFTFIAKEGHELEGWVIKPANYVPGQKYPGILTMHGGPKAAFGTNYMHEMQIFANMGYFVFFTNPRGASGRGEAFSRMVGNLGVIDYDDFMAFTDEVLSRYPDINGDSLGIVGGSYGGYMCNMMVGRTDRFKAAASQRSISNYMTKSLTTDIGYYHNLCQLAATPWDKPEKMWDHSPLKYANNAKTPTLLIHSDQDYRCWMSEPFQIFTTLRQNGVPSKVCMFHGENHELSRSGKPHNRVGRLTEICNWFATYVK